jgi:hypothetical protein
MVQKKTVAAIYLLHAELKEEEEEEEKKKKERVQY